MVEFSSPDQTNSTRNLLLGLGFGTASILSSFLMPNHVPAIPLEKNIYSYECTSEKHCCYQLKNEVMPQAAKTICSEPAVDIVQSFVNNLVVNSEKSLARYSKTVDDHFWDLA